MRDKSALVVLETKAAKVDVSTPLTIENLPARLGFSPEGPRLTAIKEELLREIDKPLPRDKDRLEKLSFDYEQAAVEFMSDWPPMRVKPAIIGALIEKSNVFGQAGYGYIDYRISALFKASEFAKEMKLDKTADVVIDALAKISLTGECR